MTIDLVCKDNVRKNYEKSELVGMRHMIRRKEDLISLDDTICKKEDLISLGVSTCEKEEIHKKKLFMANKGDDRWESAIDNILPWIDYQLISRREDNMVEIKISDIKNKIGNQIDIVVHESFIYKFRSYMMKRGYYVRIKLHSDIAIIGKLDENLIGDSIDLEAQKIEQLNGITKIIKGESEEQYDNDVYQLVMNKRNEICKKIGYNFSIKEILEQAIRNGLENVK